MQLERIEVEAFRVLVDVDLHFGQDNHPQIFPLGSENGGGKSTLLQLVFVLLHCSVDPMRYSYVRNLLMSDTHVTDTERLIARVTIRMGTERRALEFVSLSDHYLETANVAVAGGFSAHDALERSLKELERLTISMDRHKKALSAMKSLVGTAVASSRAISELLIEHLGDEFHRFSTGMGSGMASRSPESIQKYLESALSQIESEIDRVTERNRALEIDVNRISGLMLALGYKEIVTYSQHSQGPNECELVCRIQGCDASQVEEILSEISRKCYLLGPSNQQYLFLAHETRKSMVVAKSITVSKNQRQPIAERKRRPQIEYLTRLDEAERSLTGFYAYDWLSFEPLVNLFGVARDNDFRNVVKTGEYGDHYTTMIRDVNGLLLGKKVRPLDDLSGVEFLVVSEDGIETRLGPEDLSHGELKRLMIYAWLRANNAGESIVFIDEIEVSFHPDWHYGIVRDLQEWAPDNQYILATHSYHLCEALTPGHVRELEPRLLRAGRKNNHG